MKSTVSSFLALLAGSIAFVLLAFALTSCGAPANESTAVIEPTAVSSEDLSEPEPSSIITDFKASEPDIHEEVDLWPYQEGEDVGNPYYKRMVDESGELVYAVMRKSDGQVEYLPMGSTVLYASNEMNCYYERTYHQYKINGQEMQTMQYQLYVTSMAPVDALPTDPLASSVPTENP